MLSKERHQTATGPEARRKSNEVILEAILRIRKIPRSIPKLEGGHPHNSKNHLAVPIEEDAERYGEIDK